MRRKNSETCINGQDVTAACNGGGHELTKKGHEIRTAPSKEGLESSGYAATPWKQRRKTQKEGFLSFFSDHKDPRRIQKIVYPQLATDKQRPKSDRRRLLDTVYAWILGLLCTVLSGMIIGFHHFLTSRTTSSSLFHKSTQQYIQLPPNDKITLELLKSVRRKCFLLPLQLDNILPQTSTSQGANNLGFEYPEALDNSTSMGTENKMYYPAEMDDQVYGERIHADFGPVDIHFLTQEGQKREIYREVWERDGWARSLGRPRDDDLEEYWAFDDDWLRNPYVAFDDDMIHELRRCRRTNWARKSFPTGNILHEIDRVNNMPELIGEGTYREVFLVEHDVLETQEHFVLKEIHYSLNMDYDCHEYVRVDSLITERMTSNDQIVNIYGYAGLSMIAEAFSNGDVEDDIVGFEDRSQSFKPLQEPNLIVLNNFTGSEKLRLALSMVEPLAALHNYVGGIIVHDDIQLSQYLWTDETKTSVKLNDFNRAEVRFFDEEHHEYCKYRNGKGHGDWRSPEEYKDEPLDEKIDIWSLGNNFYSLLTGYYPFPDMEDTEDIKLEVSEGVIAKIDPRFLERSFAESRLAEIIEHCFVYDPDERLSINELQTMLEDAIAEDDRLAKDNYTEWKLEILDKRNGGSVSTEDSDESTHSDYEHLEDHEEYPRDVVESDWEDHDSRDYDATEEEELEWEHHHYDYDAIEEDEPYLTDHNNAYDATDEEDSVREDLHNYHDASEEEEEESDWEDHHSDSWASEDGDEDE